MVLSDELKDLRDKCVEVVEQLAEMNPTARWAVGGNGAVQFRNLRQNMIKHD